MEIHFLVMEKSWKIIVEKEWSPWMYPPMHSDSWCIEQCTEWPKQEMMAVALCR